EQLEHLVGRPDEEAHKATTGAVGEALASAAEEITQEWERKLAELAVALMEQPCYRLAGAEEAVRRAAALLEQAVRTHESLAHELTAKANGMYAALHAHLVPSRKSASWSANKVLTAKDLAEALRAYPKARYQA